MSEAPSHAVAVDQSGHAPEDRRIKFIVDMEKSFEDIREDLYYVVSHLVYKYHEVLPPEAAPAEFKHTVLKGGITNRLFVCRLAPYPPIIVRLFGKHAEAVINRVSELQVAKFISRHNVGPSIFGSFSNGRLEGFLDDTVSLTPPQMLEKPISSAVAVAVAALHSLPYKPPAPEALPAAPSTAGLAPAAAAAAAVNARRTPAATGRSLWETIEHWICLGLQSESQFVAAGDADRLATYRSLNLPRLYREFVELRATLSALEEPLVFCHNDLLSGNILHSYDEHGVPSVTLIDFEYGALNHRAFDIANHFCECCGFDCDWRQFPDEAHQRHFIRTYLRASDRYTAARRDDAPLSPTTPSQLTLATAGARGCACGSDVNTTLDADAAALSRDADAGAAADADPVLEARVEVLRRRVLGFVLAAHLFWASWSVIMSLSKGIAFDYIGYALLRVKGYYFMRSRSLLAVKPVLQAKAVTAVAADGAPVARRVAPVRAVVVGWGLAGRDLHPPSVAAAAGIVVSGAVVRPRGEDPTADAARAAGVATHLRELAYYFGEAGVVIDGDHLATAKEADESEPRNALAVCRRAAACALSAREQEAYDGAVTARGVAWNLELLRAPGAEPADAVAAAAAGAALCPAGLSLAVAPAAPAAVDLAIFSTDETFAPAHDVRVYATLEDVLADADVDLVVLASPPQTHFAYTKAALLAGKHVVSDKPFVPTVAEAEELAALARSAGRVLSIFQNRRFDGDAQTLRRLLGERALGAVKWAEFSYQKGLPRFRAEWVAGGHDDGCGRVWDLGAHSMDHAVTVFRHAAATPAEAAALRPVSVYARVLHEEPAIPQTDTHAHFTVTFNNGAVAMVDVGAFITIPKPKMLVVGDRATFAKYGDDTQESALVAGRASSAAVEPASQFGSLHVRGEPTATQVPTAPGRWAEYYQRIALAIRRGGEPPVSLADALTSTALIAGGLESALTGQAVPIKNYYE